MTKIFGLNRRSGFILDGLLLTAPGHASAQVIEIDLDGGVKTYDGPAAIRADGEVVALRAVQLAKRGRALIPGDSVALRRQAASATDLSPDLLEAVAWQESRLHPRVVSAAGAVGEMQLMPATARALGVDPFDSRQNYWGGATYLRSLIQRYDGNLVYALAAYNAGPGAVERFRGVPPFKETRGYVAAILDRMSNRAVLLTGDGLGK